MSKKVNDKLFGEIVDEVIKMKYTMPEKDTSVLVENRVERMTEGLELTENEKGDLLFAVSYAVVNRAR